MRLLLPLLMFAAVACGGSGGTVVREQAPDAVQVLRAESSAAMSSVRHWNTLRDVLPNVTYAYGDGGDQSGERVTDSVVAGRVVRTEPARGMLGEPLTVGEDVRTRIVDFDDPRASWRVLAVTVEVSETLAGTAVDELVFDWGLNGPSERGPDAEAVGKALQDLGDIVVLSKAWPDRPEFAPGRAPVPLGYGIGRVAADGRLDFPLIAPLEGPGAAAFQGDIDTLAELRAAAQAPATTKQVSPEQAP